MPINSVHLKHDSIESLKVIYLAANSEFMILMASPASSSTIRNGGRLRIAPSIVLTLSIILISMGQGLDAPYTYSYAGFGLLYLLPLLSRSPQLQKIHHSSYHIFIIATLYLIIILGLSTSVTNGDISPAISSFVYSTVFLAVIFFTYRINKIDFLLSSRVAYTASFVVIIALSLYSTQFEMYRYQGMFSNPNQMGRACVAALTIISPVIFLSHRNEKRKFFDYLVIMSAILLAAASNSRLSLGTILLLSIMIIILYCIFYEIKRRIIAYLSIFLVAMLSSYYFGIFDEIIDKFIIVQGRGDLTQGRADNWSYIVDRWTWLGHGEDPYSIFDYGAHNLFLSYLDRQGLLMAVAIYLPFVTCFFRSAYICLFKFDSSDLLNFSLSSLALTTSFCFIAVGMAEATTLSALTVAAMLGVSCWLTVENRLSYSRQRERRLRTTQGLGASLR